MFQEPTRHGAPALNIHYHRGIPHAQGLKLCMLCRSTECHSRGATVLQNAKRTRRKSRRYFPSVKHPASHGNPAFRFVPFYSVSFRFIPLRFVPSRFALFRFVPFRRVRSGVCASVRSCVRPCVLRKSSWKHIVPLHPYSLLE